MDLDETFEPRVNVEDVATVLHCIASPPNRRERPSVGDLEGNYEFWFDGGAAINQTGGGVVYTFANGTHAFVYDCVIPLPPRPPPLSITIHFSNGVRVTVKEEQRFHGHDAVQRTFAQADVGVLAERPLLPHDSCGVCGKPFGPEETRAVVVDPISNDTIETHVGCHKKSVEVMQPMAPEQAITPASRDAARVLGRQGLRRLLARIRRHDWPTLNRRRAQYVAMTTYECADCQHRFPVAVSHLEETDTSFRQDRVEKCPQCTQLVGHGRVECRQCHGPIDVELPHWHRSCGLAIGACPSCGTAYSSSCVC
jgi:hypothetical protein